MKQARYLLANLISWSIMHTGTKWNTNINYNGGDNMNVLNCDEKIPLKWDINFSARNVCEECDKQNIVFMLLTQAV